MGLAGRVCVREQLIRDRNGFPSRHQEHEHRQPGSRLRNNGNRSRWPRCGGGPCAAQTAIARARSGGGPTLIECKTYRYVGHHEGDPGTDYRTREEVQQWKQRDPVKLTRKVLLESGGADETILQSAEQEVEQLIDQAVEFAENSPEPSAESVNEHVF